MKRKMRSVYAVGCAAIIALLIGGAGKTMRAGAATQEETPKPALEMEKLKFYVGEWDYTETYPKSPTDPNGPKNTGVYTSKLGPGGNSLINTFHSKGPVGDFEGLIVMTWDPAEKVYKEYVFSGDGPGAIVETGKFEGDALVFRAEMPTPGGIIKLRNVAQVTAPGKLTAQQYVTRGSGPETLIVSVEAKKR